MASKGDKALLKKAAMVVRDVYRVALAARLLGEKQGWYASFVFFNWSNLFESLNRISVTVSLFVYNRLSVTLSLFICLSVAVCLSVCPRPPPPPPPPPLSLSLSGLEITGLI